MKKIIIVIDSKLIYNGPIKLKLDTFRINGKIFRKEVVEHNASVGIIPILNNNEIILIKQYRHAANEYLIEIPAGKIENKESPNRSSKKRIRRRNRIQRRFNTIDQMLSSTKL